MYTWADLHRLYSLSDLNAPEVRKLIDTPSYNVTPTQSVPVIVREPDGIPEAMVSYRVHARVNSPNNDDVSRLLPADRAADRDGVAGSHFG